MVELHLHLDGSLSPRVVWKLAELQGISLPANNLQELAKALIAPPDCRSLNEYLLCFELPKLVLQSAEALQLAVEELIGSLAKEGILYAEIRFAPQLHIVRGLTQEDAVRAALCGQEAGLKKNAKISSQLILCCMRGGGDEENEETLRITEKYLGHGVCAADLAGAEALYPTVRYRKLFAGAAAQGIPFTIHAGEAGGPQEILEAVSIGAKRLGHGVRAAEDPAVIELLLERKIPLELCYSSNLQTKAVRTPTDFPLRGYLQKGLCVTVNSDNRTVSGTTLNREYSLLRELGLTASEQNHILFYAAEAAFLPEREKAELMRRIREKCLS